MSGAVHHHPSPSLELRVPRPPIDNRYNASPVAHQRAVQKTGVHTADLPVCQNMMQSSMQPPIVHILYGSDLVDDERLQVGDKDQHSSAVKLAGKSSMTF